MRRVFSSENGPFGFGLGFASARVRLNEPHLELRTNSNWP